MKSKYLFNLSFICLCFLGGCQTSESKISSINVFVQRKMTIDYHITIGQSLTFRQKKDVQAIIDETFAEIDAIYNKWNPLSEISQINQLAAGQPFHLSSQLNTFLQQIDHLVKLTEGRFDPTIEPLQQLWKNKLEQNKTPTSLEIEELKPCLGWDKISIINGTIYKKDSRTRLDLGGIAKGLCVDLLVERLNQSGFLNVLVEWGGEMRASGSHPERPWNIYISRLEDSNPNHALAYISLKDQAIATSGDYFQFWTIQLPEGRNQTYCHIFDPYSLEPLPIQPGSIASASIMTSSCMLADALAKTLMLFSSLEESEKWAHTLQQSFPNLSYWIVVRNP